MKASSTRKPGSAKLKCGFCKERFRSPRQRRQHANRCKENAK